MIRMLWVTVVVAAFPLTSARAQVAPVPPQPGWKTIRQDLEVTISSDMLHDNVDYTPYEGRRITGYPVLTLSRGEVVWDGQAPKGEPGRGRFLACDLPEPARPRGA